MSMVLEMAERHVPRRFIRRWCRIAGLMRPRYRKSVHRAYRKLGVFP